MSLAVQQRTPEWFALRRGKVTASNFGRVVLGGEKSWQSYMPELDNGPPEFSSDATDWGNEQEPCARARFELLYQRVDKAGFITHPEHPMIGASPDFLVGNDGGGEIKCPFDSENHYDVLLSQSVPEKYLPQVQGSMWVTGRQYWWFISFDPRAMVASQKFIAIKVLRDDLYIQKLKKKLLDFWTCYSGDRDTSRYFGVNVIDDFTLPF